MILFAGLVEEILWVSFGLSGIAVVMCFVCGVFSTMDLIDLRAIRRLFRQPRFGLVSIFGFMSIVAIDLTLLRWFDIEPTEPSALFFGAIFFVVGLVVVTYIGLVLTDMTEGNTSSKKRKETLPEEFSPPVVSSSASSKGIVFPDSADEAGINFVDGNIPADIAGERWDEWI